MASNAYGQFNGLPKTMYTSRTRSMLPSTMPKSSSAMSTRTYSRIKGKSTKKTDSGASELQRMMNFDNVDTSQLDDSVVDLQELENEQELLKRMIDQQKQLQELRERQKRVLELQQQLASMEVNAEISMEEKLAKLKTAKTRLDQLSKLVGTLKTAEIAKKEGSGDTYVQESPKGLEKNEQVKIALEELNELKMLIGMMSSENKQPERKPAATPEPVFPNSIGFVDDAENSEDNDQYQSVLPEVSVVQYDDENDECPQYSRRSSGLDRSKTGSASQRSKPSPRSKPTPKSPRKANTYQKKKTPQKVVKKVRTKSPEKEDGKSSEGLWEEMRRHQVLLEELRRRREELEDLMNMTKESQIEEEEADQDVEEYNDVDASVKSNLGSPDESRGLSDAEGNDFDTSQSGRLFGLNESDTRRLIDLIRNQKSLGATTEKTTATWGSSCSESEEEDEDENQDDDDTKLKQENIESMIRKASGDNRTTTVLASGLKDAFTQLDLKQEHEIDFRPPTRRRRNITQPLVQSTPIDARSLKASVGKIQEDLSSTNTTLHLLLEDQQALTKLLLNTLNLQQTTTSSNLCYGISPDFLIYQLDNCSAQFAASLKETKDLQWQLYSLTKGTVETQVSAPEKAAVSHQPSQLVYQSQPIGAQSQSFAREMQLTTVPYVAENLEQADNIAKYAVLQKEDNNSTGEVAGNELFEALRDSIYSEAAILISQNEARPHFLIELFHTLQQLDSDYLRQHALYSLQDVMKGYIPKSIQKENERKPVYGKSMKVVKKTSYSENTPSDSAASSEDEMYTKLKARASADTGYDFSIKVSSASELSTPSGDETENHPFAADDLGSTVIHLDAALRHMREMERMKQEILSSTSAGDNVDVSNAAKKAQKNEVPQVNTKLLRARIKHIVSEVIPLLKSNHDKILDKKLVKILQSKIVECVEKGMNENQTFANGFPEVSDYNDNDKLSMEKFFSGQLNSILDESFKKFIGQRVGSCGEDLVVGLSEVLFNELAFFYMMQDLGKDAANKPEIPTITIEEDEENSVASESQEEDSNKESQENEIDSELSTGEENIQESEQIITQVSNSKNPVTVDLSVSESKPLTSYGSGEDEEEGSGDDYEYREPDVPTSMQQDASSQEATNLPTENGEIENDNKENNSPVVDSEIKDE